MLSKIKIERYKSLYDTEIDLEPLTVFIGANGSGKSNICEALLVLSNFLQQSLNNAHNPANINNLLESAIKNINKQSSNASIQTKLWHQELEHFLFQVTTKQKEDNKLWQLSIKFDFDQQQFLVSPSSDLDLKFLCNLFNSVYLDTRGISFIEYLKALPTITKSLEDVKIYDFVPIDLSINYNTKNIDKSGKGLNVTLAKILLNNPQNFQELEERFTKIIPNISRIPISYENDQFFKLELIDKYSNKPIPTHDISDGTLRILAFLAVLYQKETPSIICFEEPENGIHPWLLNKIMELLKIVSTEGITGKPVQVLITTHSPLLLNYVEPHQVRVVKLDKEGKTQVSPLPLDSPRFQKALEAYDEGLGELWFTDIFGGNP